MFDPIVYHPVCSVFPPMSEDEYQALKADIVANGLRHFVTFWQGQLIDGRHRARVLEEIGWGVEGYSEEMDPEADPIAFAVSANLHRRQLTASQRAMVAAGLATLQHGSNQYQKQEVQICSSTLTIEQAAETVGVGRQSVVTAKAVQRDGAPEVVEAVKAGKVSLNAAAKLVKAVPDKERQADVVGKGWRAVKEVAKKANLGFTYSSRGSCGGKKAKGKKAKAKKYGAEVFLLAAECAKAFGEFSRVLAKLPNELRDDLVQFVLYQMQTSLSDCFEGIVFLEPRHEDDYGRFALYLDCDIRDGKWYSQDEFDRIEGDQSDDSVEPPEDEDGDDEDDRL